MPAKNSKKIYISDAYYHLYNRGVEKRIIFLDRPDYVTFLSYLKEYLSPRPEQELRGQLLDPIISTDTKSAILKKLQRRNFAEDMKLVAFCLMPNHFHLLVKQRGASSIDMFMNAILTRYSLYFNRKYKRVGPLYQGVYKAVYIETDEQLLHLSRYIHRNPLALQGVALQTLSQQPSSYGDYIGKRKTTWIYPDEILSFFSKKNQGLSYESFVGEDDVLDVITDVTIDLD